MSKPRDSRFPFAKIATVLAVAFCLGLGLCGLDAVFLASHRDPNQEFGPNSIIGGIGAWVVLLSASGLVVFLAVWLVVAVVGACDRSDAEPQRLFEDRDHRDKLS